MTDRQENIPLSRYERVKQILNEAQGDHVPDYQGYRAFWLLEIEEFRMVTIYGQRMIDANLHQTTGKAASGAESHCSHCGPASSTGSGEPNCWPTTSRRGPSPGSGEKPSDRSGLIQGLKGEYPFDDSMFPPLLWGPTAQKVSASNIAFIAAWIDDGCPTSDEPAASASGQTTSDEAQAQIVVSTDLIMARAYGDALHTTSNKHVNAIRDDVSGMRVRKEVSSLNHEELSRLRAAIHCMYQYDDYWLDDRSFGYWGRIHANSCQHGWEQFLPWHRLYLYHFEQQLQDYDPHITLPYWEWSLYADLNRQTYETTILDQGFIPEAFRCWIDADGVACLKDKKQANGQPLFSDEEISGLSRSKFQVLRENSG